MTYTETVNWMFKQLPMYQTHGAIAYKADLSNTLLLAQHLGNPEKNLRFIHVAGTNGKGSTSHMLASIFQEAGYKTGLYTSPHLKDFRERIKINGTDIPEQYVVSFIDQHKSFFEANSLSFFEMSVGLAFDYFTTENVDIVILEVGLGGRLDATNIVTPLVSVITNIGIEHTQFLGDTIDKIAFEKAGIIKPKIQVVIGEYTDETKQVFMQKSTETGSPIFFASDLISLSYPTDLLGDYQKQNQKTVLQTMRLIQLNGLFNITEDHVKKGLFNVISNTKLRGRWEQISKNPTVICDTAHNRQGIEMVMKQLMGLNFSRLHIVLGVVNDKDLSEILPLFPTDAHYYFCKPEIYRGLDAEILQAEAAQFDLIGEKYNSVSAAYADARKNAAPDDLIYIGGSTFVVSEVL